MNRKLNVLWMMVLIILNITSCKREDSDTVNQDTIWTRYELFYDDNESKSYARATFRFSNAAGTKLELSEGAEVRFNDELIPWNNGLAYYEMELPGFQSSGTFTYTDLEGNNYTNSISVPTVNFPASLDSVPRNEAFELVWDGTALGAGEAVSIWVDGALEGDEHLFVESSQGASSVVMASDNLLLLPEGNATWIMERSASPGIQEATSADGILIARYRCADRSVYME